jgi:hypothetical protein
MRKLRGEQMRHPLCGQTFSDVSAYNRHVGNSGPPDFHQRVAQCPYVIALREAENRNAAPDYLAVPGSAAEAALAAERRVVFRNTPGRKRTHRNAAAKQRAYRTRKATGR